MSANLCSTANAQLNTLPRFSLPEEIVAKITHILAENDAFIAIARLISNMWSNASSESVWQLNVNCSNFKSLNRFSKIRHLRLEVFSQLRLPFNAGNALKNLPCLSCLIISNLLPHELPHLTPLKESTQLTHFELNFLDHHSEKLDLAELDQLNNLTHVHIPEFSRLTDIREHDNIAIFTNLKSLAFNDYANFTWNFMERISKLNIKRLSFFCCFFIHEDRSFPLPTSLQCLEIVKTKTRTAPYGLESSGSDNDTDDSDQVFRDVFNCNLSELKNLSFLRLEGDPICDSFHNDISDLQSLTGLFLAGPCVNDDLKNVTFNNPAALASLRSLKIKGHIDQVFNDRFDQSLGSLTQLTRLAL